MSVCVKEYRWDKMVHLLKRISTLYIALILIVSSSVAFRYLIRICLLYEKENVEKNIPPALLAAKLEPNLETSAQERIVNQVLEIQGIAATQLEVPIPVWNGDAEQENEWQDMWKAYVSPVLYATPELRLPPGNEIALIADQIRAVTGVTHVIWDESNYQTLASTLSGWSSKERFFSAFFLLYFVIILVGLLASYPIRFRRKFAVITGFEGAGSQINPEWIWLKFLFSHIIISIISYNIFFCIGYSLFPFALQTVSFLDLMFLMGEGMVMVAGMVAAVCLLGWWFSANHLNELTVSRSPVTEWIQE